MEDINQRIATYQPSTAAHELVSSMRIAIFVGISGAGKDTIKSQLLKSGDYVDIVTTTTRQPRLNDNIPEQDGLDYYFINRARAQAMLDNQEYVEVSLVHDEVNGSSLDELRRLSRLNKVVVADVDVQGLDKYKKLSQSVTALFILPPSFEVWRQRLTNRYTDQAEFGAVWPKRRASAIDELSYALSTNYYHFIINDDIDRAVKVASDIIQNGGSRAKDAEARQIAGDLLQSIQDSL